MSGVVKTLTDHSSLVGSPEPEPVALLIATGSEPLVRVIRLRDGRANLGREIERDDGLLELPDGRASRKHAEVRNHGGGWRVRDLGSHNGTYVDGRRIEAEITVPDGSIVRCGHSLFWLLGDGGEWSDDAVTVRDGYVSGPRLRLVELEVRGTVRSQNLLVLGESGAGKERMARAYHEAGPRASGPFIGVNCAAIPESVAERLLFGSKRGAYSGAEDAPGYVQAAHGGTLFLDELGDLGLALQAKMLRVLETREVWPVGASKGTPVDLGVVCATHHDLRRAVADGRFREDLYYRLAKPAVQVPPLRERKDEVPALAAMVVAATDRSLRVHPRLLEVLVTRRWPGNVRELVHEVRVAAIAARGAGVSDVRPEHLAPEAGQKLRDSAPTRTDDVGSAGIAKPRPSASEITRDDITQAIEAARGNLSAAARALGLHRTQLYRLMERHGIARTKSGEGDEE